MFTKVKTKKNQTIFQKNKKKQKYKNISARQCILEENDSTSQFRDTE